MNVTSFVIGQVRVKKANEFGGIFFNGLYAEISLVMYRHTGDMKRVTIVTVWRESARSQNIPG